MLSLLSLYWISMGMSNSKVYFSSKAKEKLGWVPKYNLSDLVKDMMKSDLVLMQKERYLEKGGYRILNYFE